MNYIKAQYNAFLDKAKNEGITLDEYRRWAAYDDNLPWRLGSGNMEGLLEEAIERIEELEFEEEEEE